MGAQDIQSGSKTGAEARVLNRKEREPRGPRDNEIRGSQDRSRTTARAACF